MKRITSLLLIMILALAMTCACGKEQEQEATEETARSEEETEEEEENEEEEETEEAETEEDDETHTEEPEPDEPEAGEEEAGSDKQDTLDPDDYAVRSIENNMSEKELAGIEKKLNSMGYYGFLRSLYTDPTEIKLEEVFYNGAGLDPDNGSPSEKVKKAYLKATGDDEIYTDITTISGKEVRDYVKKTTGHDLSEMKYPLDDWVYLEDYDLYCCEHGDTNMMNVEVSSGHKEDGEYTITYYNGTDGNYCVTFADENGTYRFISNVPEWFALDPTNGGETGQSMITDGMLIPDSDSRKLTEDDLKGLDAEELRIARNEIYARHGRIFADKELQEHFNDMEWYHPTVKAEDFDESSLNDIELYNLNFISEYEKNS